MKLASTFVLLILITLSSCSEKKIPYKDRQNATAVILNAFSITDASIKSLSYQSNIIADVLLSGGQKTGPYGIEFHQAWNISLKSSITEQQKNDLVKHLKDLEEPYRKKMQIRHSGIADYEYDFTLDVLDEDIKVRVDAAYK